VFDVGTPGRFDLAKDAEIVSIQEGTRRVGRWWYG
jgi:hypothetical protein